MRKGFRKEMNCHFSCSVLHWVTEFVCEHWENYWLLKCQEHCSLGNSWGAETIVAEVALSLGRVYHWCWYLSALLSWMKPCDISDLRLDRHSFPVWLDFWSVLWTWAGITHCNSVSSTAHDMWLLDSPCTNLGSSMAVGNESITCL